MEKEKTIELNLFQRLNLCAILPKETNWIEFSIKKILVDKLQLKESELNALGLSFGDEIKQSMVSELSSKTICEIVFSEAEFHMVVKELTAIEKNSKLTEVTGPLYEKFCK